MTFPIIYPDDIKKPAILAGKHVMYLWQIKALYRTSVLTRIILPENIHRITSPPPVFGVHKSDDNIKMPDIYVLAGIIK